MVMKDDIELRPIIVWVVILTATAVGSMIFCVFWQGGLAWAKQRFFDQAPSPVAALATLPPEPRLQADPTADMVALRLQEDLALHHYGWIDKPEGIVRLPIERAIELTARELGQ